MVVMEFSGLGSMSRAARMSSSVATLGRPPTRRRSSPTIVIRSWRERP